MYVRVCLLFAAVVFAVGCVQPPAPQPLQPDPFATPQSPQDCPDGICPLGSEGSTGVEISSNGSSPNIDELAANEVKRDECLPCRTPSTPLRPLINPQELGPQHSLVAEQVKHGAFGCEICQKPVVGRDWEDLWTDEGMSLHCMCRSCFAKADVNQRQNAFTSFLSRANPSLVKQPWVQAAIREASER